MINYGIRKIIKEKQLSNGRVAFCLLDNNNLYGVLEFDKDENLINSVCYVCKGKTKDDYFKLLNKYFRNYKNDLYLA